MSSTSKCCSLRVPEARRVRLDIGLDSSLVGFQARGARGPDRKVHSSGKVSTKRLGDPFRTIMNRQLPVYANGTTASSILAGSPKRLRLGPSERPQAMQDRLPRERIGLRP